MSIWQWVGNGFLILVGFLLPFLWIKEFLLWRQSAGDDATGKVANMRLVRRSLGVGLLLAIVILIKFPSVESLTQMQEFVKLLICLALSLVVFAVAIWDMNVVRRSIQLELEQMGLKSAQELQRIIAEATRDEQSVSSEGSKKDC